MSRRRLLAGASVAACFAAACSARSPEPKPDAPDMSAVVSAYEHPTLVLSESNLQTALDLSVSVASNVQAATDIVPQVAAAVHVGVAAETEGSQSGGDTEKAVKVTGSGFMRVHRICPGVVADAPPDEANGALDLVVGFTERGFDPVVWGSLSACRFAVEGQAVIVGGQLQVYLGESLPFDAFGSQPLIVAVAGDVSTDGVSASVDTDFRLLPSGALEYRVTVDGESVVYWDDLEQRGFRDARGTWTCDFDSKQCVNAAGEQLTW